MNHPYLKNPDLDIETVTIETDRCILHPFSMDAVDIGDLQQAFCRANAQLYISPHLPTVEDISVEDPDLEETIRTFY